MPPFGLRARASNATATQQQLAGGGHKTLRSTLVQQYELFGNVLHLARLFSVAIEFFIALLSATHAGGPGAQSRSLLGLAERPYRACKRPKVARTGSFSRECAPSKSEEAFVLHSAAVELCSRTTPPHTHRIRVHGHSHCCTTTRPPLCPSDRSPNGPLCCKLVPKAMSVVE